MAEGTSPTAAADTGSGFMPGCGRDLYAWAALGLTALAIAGVMAVLLAVSRVPGIDRVIPWPTAFFSKGLIIHVVMSIVVWFAAVFAALTAVLGAETAPPSGWRSLGTLAAAAMASSLPCLLLPAFLDRGEPSLNNYVPVIDDPLYFAGLLLLATAIMLAAVRLLVAQARTPSRPDPVRRLATITAVILLIALSCFAIAGWQLAGVPAGHWFNENLMWGGGHVMQFANAALMITAWSAIAQFVGGRMAPVGRSGVAVSLLLLLAVLPAPLFYAVFPPFSGPQAQAFSTLKYVAGVPAIIAALALAAALPRPWPWKSPFMQALALSVLLFGVGGLLGIFVNGADTRTPAHYHGMIAGVSLAAMGLFFVRFLPALDRPMPSPRAVRWAVHLFGWGQLFACAGLFIAGGYGAPRKVPGDELVTVDLGEIIGLGMNGLGGLVAVAGGIVFVFIAARALLGSPSGASSASVPSPISLEVDQIALQSHHEGERR